jgi:hypothetical protein
MDVIKYDITEAAISEMRTEYMALSIKDIHDKEGLELVHTARMVVKGKRIQVDKKRKEFKAGALEYGRKVDTEAKRITALLTPIEDYLNQEEAVVVAEKQRLKEEKEKAEQVRIQARIDELAKYGESMPFFEVATLSDDEYETILAEANLTHAKAQAQKAAEERIQKEKKEADRKFLEETQAKQKAEREELDRIKAQQDKKNAEIQAAHAKREVELKAETAAYWAEKKIFEDDKRKAQEAKKSPTPRIAEKIKPKHEYIIEDLEGDPVKAEIILYPDGEIEIGLFNDDIGLTYYVKLSVFEPALKEAKAKLNI